MGLGFFFFSALFFAKEVPKSLMNFFGERKMGALRIRSANVPGEELGVCSHLHVELEADNRLPSLLILLVVPNFGVVAAAAAAAAAHAS